MNEPQKKIMVVDDSELNLMMMESFIDPMGHEVMTAKNGREALEKINADLPDLILLDVMMPEMDGFEVCRRLKSKDRTRHIPVIIITALDKVDDNVVGIEAGADDFLTRPFEQKILFARMKALLQTKELNDEIKRLEQLKEDLTRMIVHDLRTPVSSIKMSLELLRETMPPEDPKSVELFGIASSAAADALLLINNVLDVSKLESKTMNLMKEDTSVIELIQDACNKVRPLTYQNGLKLSLHTHHAEIFCETDRVLIGRVITNLLSNAIKFAEPQSEILIEAEQYQDGHVEIGVINQGVNIPPESRQIIFEKFGQAAQTKDKNKLGTGLGLNFCKLVVEAHNGKIRVVSPPPQYAQGAAFYFSLPLR